MCGIAGWFTSKDKAKIPTRAELGKMLQLIAHRGPDGQGIYINEEIAFGHRRLAIIDLKNGQQPMHTNNGSLTITYNGEIYNYRDLKKNLTLQGCQFHTESDTEVIMQLYQLEGISGFNKLRGMFAFALWDHNQKTGYLVRDSFGIKPLFLLEKNSTIYFASEAKAFIGLNEFSPILDKKALHMLMNFRYIPGDLTLFKGVRQLEPGKILCWKTKDNIHKETISHTCRRTLSTIDAFKDSIKHHCIADVDVGAYLSGGIDSASIVAAAKENKSEINTFTIDIGDSKREAVNAKESADFLKVQNFFATAPKDLSDIYRKCIWHGETPKVNSIQSYLAAELASKHNKVVLSGLGADELFYGYNIYSWQKKIGDFNRLCPNTLSNIAAFILESSANYFTGLPFSEPARVAKLLKTENHQSQTYGLLRNIWDSQSTRKLLYSQEMLQTDLPDCYLWLSKNWPEKNSVYENIQEFEWQHKMVNDLLWNEDRSSMAHGLESRTPFVDRTLVSSLTNINPEILYNNRSLKLFMKQEISRQFLSQRILNRKKSGFQLDISTMYKKNFETLEKNWLSKSVTEHYGLFNYKFIDTIKSRKPGKNLRWHLFTLLLIMGAHIWLSLFSEDPLTS